MRATGLFLAVMGAWVAGRASAFSSGFRVRRRPRSGARVPVTAAAGDTYLGDLLTEQAVKTAAFYFQTLRDPSSSDWVKRFYNETFSAECRTTDFFRALLRREPEDIFVQHLRRKRQGTPGNPYLNQQKAVYNYTILIEPRVIAEKIFAAREQLAGEWAEDLDRILASNEEILRFYQSKGQLRNLVYDPEDSWFESGSSSPYRVRHFEVLRRELTARGVRNAYDSLNRAEASWLDRAMDMAAAEALEGDQLLEKMIRGPLILLPPRDDDKLRAIEPDRIVQRIMDERLRVSDGWRRELRGVSELHQQLRVERLNEQFRVDYDGPGLAA